MAATRVARRTATSMQSARVKNAHPGVHVTAPGWNSPQADDPVPTPKRDTLDACLEAAARADLEATAQRPAMRQGLRLGKNLEQPTVIYTSC